MGESTQRRSAGRTQPVETRAAFGRWLSNELDRRRWSRDELATMLDTQRSTVAKWILGRRSISYPYVVVLADALGYSIDTVLTAAGQHPISVQRSAAQDDACAIIEHLPDDLINLAVMPHLRGLLNENMQRDIRAAAQSVSPENRPRRHRSPPRFSGGVARRTSGAW